MGKTTLAMQFALTVAKARLPVLVFSLEMTPVALAERALASTLRVDATKMRKGTLEKEDWSKISSAYQIFNDMPLYIDKSARLTIERMRSRAKNLKARCGLSLIVVDYIQLMEADGDNRNEQISTISRGMKLLANELDVPLVALSQLSRKCDERTDKRPLLSDLRDSGAIEQDADVVMTVYRDEVYHPGTDAKGIAEINIAKNREGETGRVYATFLGHLNRFENTTYRPSAKEGTTPTKARDWGFYG